MATQIEPIDTTNGPVPGHSPQEKGTASATRLVRIVPIATVIAVAIDILSASLAVALGLWWSSRNEVLPPIWMIALFVPFVVVLFGVQSLYRDKLGRRFIDEFGPIQTNVALAAVLVLSTVAIARTGHPFGAVVAKTWLCAAVLMPPPRLLHAMIQKRLRKNHHFMTPTLIVGSGKVANRIIERLRSHPEYGLTPIGLVDTEIAHAHQGARSTSHPEIPIIGTPDAIATAIQTTGAEAVLIAFSQTRDELLIRVVRVAHRHKVRVWVVPRMFDAVGERAGIEHLGGLPLLALPNADPHGWQFTVKHVTDRMVAALGLVAISPLLLCLILLIRLSSPGPIFFGQERVGRDGRVFRCLKFRTMRPPEAADARFELTSSSAPGGVEGEDRRTPVGKFMRSTSLDELPQLINVLKGEMSLVGPRPERPQFVEFFEIQIHRYGERHRVKAGMTGWAQVHGLRGQTSIADRVEWDNYYIENWSLVLDLKIIALTVKAVMAGAE